MTQMTFFLALLSRLLLSKIGRLNTFSSFFFFFWLSVNVVGLTLWEICILSVINDQRDIVLISMTLNHPILVNIRFSTDRNATSRMVTQN